VIEDYLSAAIVQSIARARLLSNDIDGPNDVAYDGLRQLCGERLDKVVNGLRTLESELVVDQFLQGPSRLRRFQRLNRALLEIETIGANALVSQDERSRDLTAIVRSICTDMSYPLVPPTICNNSRDYIFIYPDYDLIMVPLLEGRFLLHLPDLFHELAHPFLNERFKERLSVEPYRNAAKQAKEAVKCHFRGERKNAERGRLAAGFAKYLHLWERQWNVYWLEEFFCDAFAAATCGPAYAWSHYHLCAKHGGNAFECSVKQRNKHPADDARMAVVLGVCRRFGFGEDADAVQTKWEQFLRIRGDERAPEYIWAYPQCLIDLVCDCVLEALRKMKVRTVRPGDLCAWPQLLNQAWEKFWTEAERYRSWEENRINVVLSNLSQ
jgi:hypothetical protein